MHAIRRKLRNHAKTHFIYEPINPNAVLFRIPRSVRKPIFSHRRVGGIHFVNLFRLRIQFSITR